MIHSTAIIEQGAQIGERVDIGPYTIVGSRVVLGDDCRVGSHVVLAGDTTVGGNTRIHTGAVLGDVPQDTHYAGADTSTRIGENCVVREYVTVHRGTEEGTSTTVGNGVMLMALSHLGHNCRIADNVIIANACLLAGHVDVAERAFLSGGVMVHQFVRIGTMAMIHGGERVTQDVPPYCIMAGGGIRGPNTVGLKRAGLTREAREAVRGAIKLFFFSGLNRPNALVETQAEYGDVAEVEHLMEFVRTTERGLVSARREGRNGS